MVSHAQQEQAFVQWGMVQVCYMHCILLVTVHAMSHWMVFLWHVQPHSRIKWNVMLGSILLGFKINSIPVVDHGGCGLATNANTSFTPADLICQYFGRFLVLTQAETDQLFHPMFFENHERLVLLTSVMQPIVHEHQTVPDSYDQVIFLVLKLYMQRCS